MLKHVFILIIKMFLIKEYIIGFGTKTIKEKSKELKKDAELAIQSRNMRLIHLIISTKNIQ